MLAFHASARARIEELTSTSRAIEDLADSFPALLYATATEYATPARRRKALRLVVEEAPLRLAAEAIGLAWWMRRLPAQALIEPLRPLPDDAEFNERIASFLPASPEQARSWLWTVSYGTHACHKEFALWAASWAARQRRTFDAGVGRDHFRYLAAWAWHAGQPGAPGSALLRKPWTPHVGIRRAVEELSVWRRRLRLALCLGRSNEETWVREGTALGYQFVALRTPEDFIGESEAMDNCLDQFADRLESGRSRVFSIRKSGRPVADVEIGTDALDAGMPRIQQLRGPRNRLTTPEVWRAAYIWLGSQALRPLLPSPVERSERGLRRAARAYWRPYIAALDADLAAEFSAMLASDLGFRIAPRARKRSAREHAESTEKARGLARPTGLSHS
jgi:hypothetical protein